MRTEQNIGCNVGCQYLLRLDAAEQGAQGAEGYCGDDKAGGGVEGVEDK